MMSKESPPPFSPPPPKSSSLAPRPGTVQCKQEHEVGQWESGGMEGFYGLVADPN